MKINSDEDIEDSKTDNSENQGKLFYRCGGEVR